PSLRKYPNPRRRPRTGWWRSLDPRLRDPSLRDVTRSCCAFARRPADRVLDGPAAEPASSSGGPPGEAGLPKHRADLLDRALDAFGPVLGLGAAVVDQDGGHHDEREQLQELRLPVLQRRLPELHPEVRQVRHLAVGRLLVGERRPFGDALRGPAHEEQDREGQAEAEVAPETADPRATPLLDDAAHEHAEQERGRPDQDERGRPQREVFHRALRRRLDPASAPGRTPDDDRSFVCPPASAEQHEQEQDRRNRDDDPDPWLHRSLLPSLIERCLPEEAPRHTPGTRPTRTTSARPSTPIAT